VKKKNPNNWLVYILNLFNQEAPMKWDAIKIFLIFSVPSILYLIYWKLIKGEIKRKPVFSRNNSNNNFLLSLL